MAIATQAAESPAPAEEGRVFRRFDIHQRIQHWLMISSFLTLVSTGFPLRMAGEGGSRALVDLFGSLNACGTIHRTAAIGLMTCGLYHLIYVGVLWKKKRLGLAITPTLKDFRDLRDNVWYFLGLRKEPPAFGRFTYFEKFDYFAVFWGMVIMIGSGLVLWFPVAFMSFLPGWVLTICMIAHSDEALLAALAIFIWHFYNVHLRRTVFPMNWVWLTGNLTEEEMKRDHAAEYQALQAKAGARRDDSAR